MTTKIAAPETLLIKLSTQQHHDFTVCARACGLDLAAWIVQCADVQAAAAIDAMQSLQRVQRPDRKKQRPRQRTEHPVDENLAAEDPAPKGLAAKSLEHSKDLTNKNATAKEATLKAARTYNERFRRRLDEKRKGAEETGGKRDRTPPRRKSRALTEAVRPRGDARLAERPTSAEGAKTVIDPLTGDLPAVTLKDSREVLLHFERVDPRLAEAWRRDVVVHEGPITLRRVMSPANFGGATHYAYVDRRLIWYLRRDPTNPVGARWEGYLAVTSDAPPDTIVVFVGRDILAKKCPPQLDDDIQTKKFGEVPPTREVSSTIRNEEYEERKPCNGGCVDDA